ncbi:MAG: arginine--tRNA ligase [Candidatus Hydrogenedentota bacterium]
MPFLDKAISEQIVSSFKKSISENIDPQLYPYLKVVPNQKQDYGDYQFNGAMALAKIYKKSSKEIALLIQKNLGQNDFRSEIAGPGFINFKLNPYYCYKLLIENYASPSLGIPQPEKLETIVIDFSSPNVAKPMHIGHIRSTIIGDSIRRILKELGHTVIADNHIGDWGTQFGKLIYSLKHFANIDSLEQEPMQKLLEIYVDFEKKEKNDPDLTEKAKQELVKLQNNDKENIEIWQKLVDISSKEWSKIYKLLDIGFDYSLGESFYQAMLPGIVSEFINKGIAKIDDGACCLFFPEQTKLSPVIIRKQDGGFLYATTDIATIKYRIEIFKPDRILYVTDDRQSLHFQQLFYTAKNYMNIACELEHISFGLMRLADGHLSTREGRVIELSSLLSEAKERAYRLISDKRGEMDESHKQKVAEIIGTGAVKYNDLSQNRETMVVFEWDKMLSFDGNTAPYLQYTCARIKSIFEKGNINENNLYIDKLPDNLNQMDINLLKSLLFYPENVRNVTNKYYPHLLCEYLFNLANTFHKFYIENPVLKADSSPRQFRLLLCDMTLKIMTRGLSLLGIKTIHPM